MNTEIDLIYEHSIFKYGGEYVPEYDFTENSLSSQELRDIETVRVHAWWESIKCGLVVEHQEVSDRYEKLKSSLEGYMTPEDVEEIYDAYLYMYFCHNYRPIDPAKRFRKDNKTHYSVHPLEVTQTLAEMKLRKITIISSLLHDTREDTYATSEEIYSLFGNRVGQNVEDLTKIRRGDKKETASLQLYKLYLSVKDIDSGGNPEIVVIKLADKLDNMRTLGNLDPKRRKETAQNTYTHFVPLAERLGLPDIAEELRYLSLKHTTRKSESALKRTREWNAKLNTNPFLSFLRSQNHIMGPNSDIQLEMNSIGEFVPGDSRKDSKPTPQSASITITYESPDERNRWLKFLEQSCMKPSTATRIRSGQWEIRNFLFGDISWNITLLSDVNFQFKKLSIIDRYKYEEENPEMIRKQLNGKLSDTRNIIRQYEEGDVEAFMEAVTERFPFEQISVMTPKGERRILNKGSTGADFAYEIHEELLPRAVGIRINGGGTIQPLNSVLKPEDTIEVVTERSWVPLDPALIDNNGLTNPFAANYYRRSLLTMIERSQGHDNYYHVMELFGAESAHELERIIAPKEEKLREIALNRLKELYAKYFEIKLQEKTRFSDDLAYDLSAAWTHAAKRFRDKFGTWDKFLYSYVLTDIHPRFISDFLKACEKYEATQYDTKPFEVVDQNGVIADFATTLQSEGVGIVQFRREVNNAKTPPGVARIRFLLDPMGVNKSIIDQRVQELKEVYAPTEKSE